MKKVIVIGGGPAGMIAAGTASMNGSSVILFEKNNKLGKKLFITGKGRCNVTNDTDPEGLIENTPGNPYFMYSSYYTFDSRATMDFFENLGVPLKTERGKRVFPKSEKSSDIVKAMKYFIEKNGVDVKLNSNVDNIIIENDTIKAIIADNKQHDCDALIIATGGLSYPVTGSTGDGYKFAKMCGHNVTKLYPSLVPLKCKEEWCSELQGLSLKNVEVKVLINEKIVFKDFGEMMFTHFGITGPLVLTASRFITDKMALNPKIVIDLKPALSEKELDSRILKDFEKFKNKDFANSLDELLPKKLIPVIIDLSNINPRKKVNEITKDERRILCNLLKNLTVNVSDTSGYSEAVITAGGVDINEIDPSTMRSKIIPNLYFAGEVLDVDCYTGGFNLQAAFSTGYIAGTNV